MDIRKDYLENAGSIIRLALQEDIATGDITTQTIIPVTKKSEAKLIAKQGGIISGLAIARKVFELLEGKEIKWDQKHNDGDLVTAGTELVNLSASYQTILSGERTALNFFQRMSGVATKTNKLVQKLEGTETKLLDTRKTLPGFRYLDKYSVLVGGGRNHRLGLYDMVMLKENHIRTAGSITNAVRQIRNQFHDKYKIEVETTNIEEVKEAARSNVDIIMLDNMSNDLMAKCVKIINGKIKTEASGNITIDNIRAVALTGVDYISVGSITHSVSALDISLLIQ